jgi:hypothetical protein
VITLVLFGYLPPSTQVPLVVLQCFSMTIILIYQIVLKLFSVRCRVLRERYTFEDYIIKNQIFKDNKKTYLENRINDYKQAKKEQDFLVEESTTLNRKRL